MLIHIGLSRAGSTYLQQVIFPSFKKSKYINLFNHKKFRLNFFYNYNYLFQKKFPYKFDIMSCENFLNPYTNINLLLSQIRYFEKSSPKKKIEVLLILRKPFEHLLSLYNYSVANGKVYEKLDDIFDFSYFPYASNMNKNKPFTITAYNYKSLIKNLKKNFKVHIFWYEDIFENQFSIQNFQSKLSKILSKDFEKLNNSNFNENNKSRNRSLSKQDISKKRIKNFKLKKIKLIVNKSYFKTRFSVKFKRKFIIHFNKMNNS